MNYIEFFEKEVPDWMRESNRMMQLVGFNTPAYWNWVVVSIDKVAKNITTTFWLKINFILSGIF